MAIAGQAKFLEIKITVLSPMGSFNNHMSKERGRGSRYKGLTIYRMSTFVHWSEGRDQNWKNLVYIVVECAKKLEYW